MSFPDQQQPSGSIYVPGPQPPAVPSSNLVPAPAGQPDLIQVGEIVVTGDEIHTPAGTFPRATTRWTIGQPIRQQGTPTWATVLAVVLIPCTGFLSLLFLLIKEPVGSFAVPVGLIGEHGHEYRTTVYRGDMAGCQQLMADINQARG